MTDGGGPSGVMIAAPSSGSGKTIITLGLLRALSRRGCDIAGAKAGPDYIDPAFHENACGKSSVNLDPWAMSASRLNSLAARQQSAFLLVEAMMGLFDGAADGTGSAADLAETLGLPVVLVVDAARQSHSIAALIRGFRDHRENIEIAGVILNRVGSARHGSMLRSALESISMPVLGTMPRLEELNLPGRHLGLVQAGEQSDLESFVEQAGDIVDEHVAIDMLLEHFRPIIPTRDSETQLPALGNRIAIARDAAFSFIYPHVIGDWADAGAQISFFSPMNDEAPDASADAIFLPGGYPELHCEKIAAAQSFKQGIREAATRGVTVYGECGGYMVLGEGIKDAAGNRHQMCGLLQLETSFAKRKLHLGYRKLTAETDFTMGGMFTGHEFHYTTALREEGVPLFSVTDALDSKPWNCGLRSGNVMGSYMHIIDRVAS
ncbi:MAG: cobyrinate a,c-diamide synthase [Pseudomonadota bacterium]